MNEDMTLHTRIKSNILWGGLVVERSSLVPRVLGSITAHEEFVVVVDQHRVYVCVLGEGRGVSRRSPISSCFLHSTNSPITIHSSGGSCLNALTLNQFNSIPHFVHSSIITQEAHELKSIPDNECVDYVMTGHKDLNYNTFKCSSVIALSPSVSSSLKYLLTQSMLLFWFPFV